MPPRRPTHRYVDPLDHVWLAAARRIGLRIERSSEVYAHAAGDGRLIIGTSSTLDPDDCLAQMILHELCHALVEGPESLQKADWGLDNTSPKDLVREHACLRLQAHLASRIGLRSFLGATTVFRSYYDQLPEDAIAPGEDPAIELARAGRLRAEVAPFDPHLRQALEATEQIVRAASDFRAEPEPGELPDMYALVTPRRSL